MSKLSIYHHFGSKAGLVQALLARRSERVTDWLTQAARSAGPDPRAQLRALIEAMGAWYTEPGFHGCAMINAAVELRADQSTAATAIPRLHLHRLQELLADVAASAGSPDPHRTALDLLLTLEGATTVAFVLGSREIAESATRVALAVLDHATP